MLCPNLDDKAVLADFNDIVERLGGRALEEKDVADRAAYKDALSEPQANAYFRGYYLWDHHQGDYGKIAEFLDAVDKVKGMVAKAAKVEEKKAEPVKIEELPVTADTIAKLKADRETIDKLKSDLEIKGAGRIGDVGYKILQADNGSYYFTRTKDGIRTEKGGLKPYSWSIEQAREKVLDEARFDMSMPKEESPGEAPPPQGVEEPTTPKEKKTGNFEKGDRVVLTGEGDMKGRHGIVIKKTVIGWQSIYGGKPADFSAYYEVKTDAGAKAQTVNDSMMEKETKPLEDEAVPDIEHSGVMLTPRHFLDTIAWDRKAARDARAMAGRARKPTNVRIHNDNAARHERGAAAKEAIFNAWAAKYPNEAEKYKPQAKTAVALPTQGKEAAWEAGIKKSATEYLKDSKGLDVVKTTTNNGKPVWNVSGNTRQHAEEIRKAGGRWYGPKKVWSFYGDEDPSDKIARRLGWLPETELKELEGKEAAPVKTPYQLGKEAFERGAKAFPILDKEFWPTGETKKIKDIEEWTRGWHAANAAAPVPEVDKDIEAASQEAIDEGYTEAEVTKAVGEAEALGAAESVDKTPAELVRDIAGLAFDEDKVILEGQALTLARQMNNAFEARIDERYPSGKAKGPQPASYSIDDYESSLDLMQFETLADHSFYDYARQFLFHYFDEMRGGLPRNSEKMADDCINKRTGAIDWPPALKRQRPELFDEINAYLFEQHNKQIHNLLWDFEKVDKPDDKVILEEETDHGTQTDNGESAGPAGQPLVEAAPGLAGGELPAEGAAASRRGQAPGTPRPGGGGGNVPRSRTEREGTGVRPGAGAGKQPDKSAGRPGKLGEPSGTPDAAAGGEAENLDGGVTEATPVRNRNYRIAKDDTLYHSGAVARINANVRAIALLKALERENRDATDAEKKILLQFTGWGAVAQQVFNPTFDHYVRYGRRSYPDPATYYKFLDDRGVKYKEWEERWGKALHPELGGLFTEEEWQAAQASGTNAHYTSREVIENGLWPIARRLGFKKGIAADPAMGNGLILGLIPEGIAGNVKLVGVELDDITGRITQKLYPDADIQVTGFQDAVAPDRSLDVVISNFPFGDYPIADTAHPAYSGWSIHNYFFARSLDTVRSGGLVVAITSRYTMDSAKYAKVRQYLAEKADFVGAIRLPNNAFAKNAGTEVTTDIVILRKKSQDNYPVKLDWLHNKDVDLGNGKKVSVNEYFVDHPEMVLGEHSLEGTMYAGKEEYTLRPVKGASLPQLLTGAIQNLPKNIIGEGKAMNVAYSGQRAEAEAREGEFVAEEGKVFIVHKGLKEIPEWSNDKAKVDQALQYMHIRDQANDFIKLMRDPAADEDAVNMAMKELNRLYDAYVKKYDVFHNMRRHAFLSDDTEFPVALALEKPVAQTVTHTIKEGPKKGQSYLTTSYRYEKFDILKKRTVFPFQEPSKADSIDDAVLQSLTYRNRIDPAYVGMVTGKTADEARSEILDRELGFEDPATGYLVPKSEYLSGNVREKLRIAEEGGFKKNAEALRKVQPRDWTIDEIYFKIGSEWIPPNVIEQFLKEVMDVDARLAFTKVSVGEDGQSQWTIDYPGFSRWAYDSKVYTQWGYADTKRNLYYSGNDIVVDSLNLKRPKIELHEYDDNGNITRTWTDEQGTVLVQQKQKEIQQEFRRWVMETRDVAEPLARTYNVLKNSFVVRQHDVPKIAHFPNSNHEINLRDSQKRGVKRGLAESTLFAHAVGTGKTYLYTSLAMELRRTGQAHKPIIIVQGSTISQFGAQARRLYPGARMLVPSKVDRQKQNRQTLLSRIATGDWDMVILPHNFFDMIAVSPERERTFLGEQIQEIRAAIVQQGGDPNKKGGGRGASQNAKMLAKLLKKKEERMHTLLTQKQDIAMYWEDMGVDALLVDEAHYYKRGDFYTKMDNVKGLDRSAAAKSFRFLMKVRALQEKTGGKNVYLATGTPVSNTIAELWTLLRYVRPDVLKDYGAEQFDSWATTFGDTVLDWEKTETGDYKQVDRFNRYVNGRNLINMWLSAADVILQEDVPDWKDNVPALKGGEIQSIVTPRSEALAHFIREIKAARDVWNELKGEDKMTLSWIPLDLFGQARLAAIDLRLVKADAEDNPKSKINVTVDEAFQTWQDTADTKGTQLIFCDVVKGRTRTNLYEDMKKKLIAKGVPSTQIAIINDEKYNNDTAKEALFEKVNAGDVRVIFGSTQKLGIGVNVQERAVRLFHVDAPLRPMDFEQRNGRILRPGNTNKEVEITAMAALNTLDSVSYDRLQKKQKFTNQLLRGNLEGNSFEDPADELQYSFEMLMAESEGNPLVRQRFELEGKLREMEILKNGFIQKRGQLRQRESELTDSLPRIEKDIAKAEDVRDKALKVLPPDKPLTWKVSGTEYPTETEGAKALMEAIKKKKEAMLVDVKANLNEVADNVETKKVRDFFSALKPVVRFDGRFAIDLQLNGQTALIHFNTNTFASLLDLDKAYINAEKAKTDKGIKPVADAVRALGDDWGIENFSVAIKGFDNLATGNLKEASHVGTSLRTAVKHLGEQVEYQKNRFATTQKDIANIKEELKKQFDKDDEIRQAKEEYAAVLKGLAESESEMKSIDISPERIVELWGLYRPRKLPKPGQVQMPRPTPEQAISLANDVLRRRAPEKTPEGLTLYSNPVPELVRLITSMGKDAQAAYPHVVDLGTHFYREGARKFSDWRIRMKEALKDLWDRFKGLMGKVFAAAKKAYKESPLANERGAIGAQDLEDSLEKLRAIDPQSARRLEAYLEEPQGPEAKGSRLEPVRNALKELFEAYKRPPQTTEFEDIKGRYTGEKQRIGLKLKAIGRKINAEVPAQYQIALSNWVNAQGDEALLREWADESRPLYKKEYELARNLPPEYKAWANRLADEQEETFYKAIDAGIVMNYAEGYVRGQWQEKDQIKAGRKVMALAASGAFRTRPREAMHKVFANYHEGEMAGFNPSDKRIGAQFVLGQESVRMAILARKTLADMMGSKEKDGLPTVAIGGSGRPVPQNRVCGHQGGQETSLQGLRQRQGSRRVPPEDG